MTFEGLYCDKGMGFYWEATLEVQRLMLTLGIFLPDKILRMIYYQLLTILILFHHNFIQPYKYMWSNRAASLSLLLLVFGTMINALRACFLDAGLLPVGRISHMFQILRIIENLFPSILVGFIVFVLIFRKR